MTAQTTDATEPKYNGDQIVSFRADDPRIELLDELCEKYDLSRSELLRTAIAQLEQMEGEL